MNPQCLCVRWRLSVSFYLYLLSWGRVLIEIKVPSEFCTGQPSIKSEMSSNSFSPTHTQLVNILWRLSTARTHTHTHRHWCCTETRWGSKCEELRCENEVLLTIFRFAPDGGRVHFPSYTNKLSVTCKPQAARVCSAGDEAPLWTKTCGCRGFPMWQQLSWQPWFFTVQRHASSVMLPPVLLG